MPTNSYNRTLAVSQKIYGWLLLAYPPGHREAYGAAMVQLFRDQCRDAWAESPAWGVTKLWLRVLPDLVSTSIKERIAALNERKSRTDKLAGVSSFNTAPSKIFSRVFVVVFLAVFALSVAITFMLPKSYASDSKLLLRILSASGPQTNAPYVMQTQLETIKSEAVLLPVIDKLNLAKVWGKKYFAGKTLSTPETLELLKNRVFASAARDSMVINVTVYSDDKIEATELNRAIIESFRASQSAEIYGRDRQRSEKINSLMATAQEQDAPISGAKKKVESLRQEYNISPAATGPQSPAEQPYWDAKREVASLVQASHERWAKIKSIIQEASPGYVAKPNKPLNISLGAFFGILLAGVLGAIAAFIASRIRRRNQNRSAPA